MVSSPNREGPPRDACGLYTMDIAYVYAWAHAAETSPTAWVATLRVSPTRPSSRAARPEDLRAAGGRPALVLLRVHAPAHRGGGGAALAGDQGTGAAAAHVRLRHLRGGRLDPRAHGPGHGADRRADVADAGRALHRRQPLRRRAAQRDRILRGCRGPQCPGTSG